jgi:hypothetical protein
VVAIGHHAGAAALLPLQMPLAYAFPAYAEFRM